MAMTNYMDDTIKNLTDALKEKGMWENTLVVFTTDNGGPIYEPGAANNYPLRGGKYTDFEGGIRTNTFISGGFVPKDRRGSVYNHVVSIADWYYMFSELAGVDPTDHKAEEANVWLKSKGLTLLPPIDGQPGMLDHIVGGTQGRNGSLYLSEFALLDYPFKLVTGSQPYNTHTGPLYPNCSTVASLASGHGPDFCDVSILEKKIHFGDEKEWRGDCRRGCLFNIEQDPGENNDLSADPQNAARLESMIAELARYNTTLFAPDRGDTHLTACFSAMYNGGGHFGPFKYIDGYYTDKPRVYEDLTDSEKLQMIEMASLELSPVTAAFRADFTAKLLDKYLELATDACCTTDFFHQCGDLPSRTNMTTIVV